MFLRIAALALISASLAGCIVVPAGRYRGHGYVAAPVTPGVYVEGHYRSGDYRDGRRGDYRGGDRDWDRDDRRGR